tara:strand:+ start:423 stop:608 length:186 start_codon:yes stop_codon:yes gene_type:complete
MPTDKEMNRLFWSVKAHLIPESWSLEAKHKMYDVYFKRQWCNNEQSHSEEEFEKAYEQKYG